MASTGARGPAGQVLDAQLAATWFRFADENKSGMIEGGEAVAFFGRSGLPQDVLAQVRD